MTKYELMKDEAFAAGLTVEELPFRYADGLLDGFWIGIRAGMTTVEKKCVLAEEVAHAQYTVGNILDQSDVSNRKQELFARTKAYDRLIGLSGLISAFQHGCRNAYEVAEFLEVTEPFLLEAIERYRAHYGAYARFGDYIVQFEPWLAVTELFAT